MLSKLQERRMRLEKQLGSFWIEVGKPGGKPLDSDSLEDCHVPPLFEVAVFRIHDLPRARHTVMGCVTEQVVVSTAHANQTKGKRQEGKGARQVTIAPDEQKEAENEPAH